MLVTTMVIGSSWLNLESEMLLITGHLTFYKLIQRVVDFETYLVILQCHHYIFFYLLRAIALLIFYIADFLLIQRFVSCLEPF